MSDSDGKTRDLIIHNPENPSSVARVSEDGTVTHGKLVEQREGEPIDGEILKVFKTPCSPLVHECESLFDPTEFGIPSRGGPARVSTPAYRDGWDAIFGKSDKQLLN